MTGRTAIVDNGRRRALVIAGLFDGFAGESEGVLSFVPNRAGRRAAEIRGGLLDGEPVYLELVKAPDAADRFASFRYRRS